MPFYAFQCEHCQEVFEVRATIKERTAGLQPECPSCHETQVKPLITAGLVVRGSDGGSLSLSPRGCGPNARPGCCG
jgi:putative FmdB family regulatory protein